MFYTFTSNGLVFKDEEGVIVATFKFYNDWSLNTIEMDGHIYTAEAGFEEDRIAQWIDEQPDYSYAAYTDTEVMVFTRQIAFGPMFVVCIADGLGVKPTRTLAKVVLFECPDDAAGEWGISLFDNDEEKDFNYRLVKYPSQNEDDFRYCITPY